MREQANKATGSNSSAFRRLREASKSTSVLSFGVGALYGVPRLSDVTPVAAGAGQWELAVHQMGCSSEPSGVVATSNKGTQLVINLVPKSGHPPAVAVETPNCHPPVVYH